GDCLLHGPKYVAIVERREAMGKSALNANLGCAHVPGFDSLLRDLFQAEGVGIGFTWPTAEGTKLAAHEADVGEIDIPVNYVGDNVADQFPAQRVCGNKEAEKVVPVGIGQARALLACEDAAVESFHHLLKRDARLATDTRGNLRPLERGKVF